MKVIVKILLERAEICSASTNTYYVGWGTIGGTIWGMGSRNWNIRYICCLEIPKNIPKMPRGLLSIYRWWATSGPEDLNLWGQLLSMKGGCFWDALECDVTIQFSSVQCISYCYCSYSCLSFCRYCLSFYPYFAGKWATIFLKYFRKVKWEKSLSPFGPVT